MKFKDRASAVKHFVKYSPISDEDIKDTVCYWYDYEPKPKMGEWMLFRHIRHNDRVVSPAILALIVGHTVWDMALVLEYVTEWRGWEYNSEIFNEPTGYYFPLIDGLDKQVKYIQFWTDNIEVLGHWKIKPSFRELRSPLKNIK